MATPPTTITIPYSIIYGGDEINPQRKEMLGQIKELFERINPDFWTRCYIPIKPDGTIYTLAEMSSVGLPSSQEEHYMTPFEFYIHKLFNGRDTLTLKLFAIDVNNGKDGATHNQYRKKYEDIKHCISILSFNEFCQEELQKKQITNK